MAQPQFGETVPIEASAETLHFLTRRRSASALTLAEPGPSPAQLAELLQLATRVPDHGKLAPWRFIIIANEAKRTLLQKLEPLADKRSDAAKAKATLEKLRRPPITIAVVSHVTQGAIPEWEQILSAGAVCTLLLNAAMAMGFGANWITDWYAYDETAKALIGAKRDERIAGFIHIGTASEMPKERERPDPATLTTWLAL